VSDLLVGVMSGTSLDGADAALVDFSGTAPRTLAFATVAFRPDLRERILALCGPGRDSIDLAAQVTSDLCEIYAEVVEAVLAHAEVSRDRVSAIGCHGQTVRHRPESGFTVQLNDPARLVELTGIDVVADFRRRDMAAGGQGAPLVPAFHDFVFRHPSRSRAVVNIGGIGNVTWLHPGRPTLGFDCGPGNALLDAWAKRHLGTEFDEDGRWALEGRRDESLLRGLLSDPYFSLQPPKSTGREHFHLEWLERHLPSKARAEDVQATLLELTAKSILEAIDRHCRGTEEIYLAGGGARNPALAGRIAELADGRPVAPTDVLGVPSGHVEPVAFAWFALKCVRREPIDLTTITGARAPRVLGAIYPA
jgi:anhydro-N-acetylmuramic acid kinase